MMCLDVCIGSASLQSYFSYNRGVSVVLLEDRIAAAHCLAPLLENVTNLRSLVLNPVDALLKAEPRIGHTLSSLLFLRRLDLQHAGGIEALTMLRKCATDSWSCACP